jgi:hypothetical protein
MVDAEFHWNISKNGNYRHYTTPFSGKQGKPRKMFVPRKQKSALGGFLSAWIDLTE